MDDELVKRLREPCQYENCILCQQAADAIEELIDKLNHADDQIERLVEAAEERRWIPVTERLPSDRVEVLVSSGIFAPLIEVAFYDGLFYSAWDGKTKIVAVTHWMPLPQEPGVPDINVGNKEKI